MRIAQYFLTQGEPAASSHRCLSDRTGPGQSDQRTLHSSKFRIGAEKKQTHTGTLGKGQLEIVATRISNQNFPNDRPLVAAIRELARARRPVPARLQELMNSASAAKQRDGSYQNREPSHLNRSCFQRCRSLVFILGDERQAWTKRPVFLQTNDQIK